MKMPMPIPLLTVAGLFCFGPARAEVIPVKPQKADTGVLQLPADAPKAESSDVEQGAERADSSSDPVEPQENTHKLEKALEKLAEREPESVRIRVYVKDEDCQGDCTNDADIQVNIDIDEEPESLSGLTHIPGATCEIEVKEDDTPYLWHRGRNLMMSLDYSYDYQGSFRPGVGAVVYPFTWLGAELTAGRNLERSCCTSGELWSGDANILLRLPFSEDFQMYGGAGTRWIYDKPRLSLGWNLTAGSTAFLADHIVVQASADLSDVESRRLVHLRSTVGLKLWPVELYGGYGGLGHSEKGGDNLAWAHGPIVGVRAWF